MLCHQLSSTFNPFLFRTRIIVPSRPGIPAFRMMKGFLIAAWIHHPRNIYTERIAAVGWEGKDIQPKMMQSVGSGGIQPPPNLLQRHPQASSIPLRKGYSVGKLRGLTGTSMYRLTSSHVFNDIHSLAYARQRLADSTQSRETCSLPARREAANGDNISYRLQWYTYAFIDAPQPADFVCPRSSGMPRRQRDHNISD